eukprot:5508669-Pyramimonas_sp.AAC.1
MIGGDCSAPGPGPKSPRVRGRYCLTRPCRWQASLPLRETRRGLHGRCCASTGSCAQWRPC